MHAFQIDGQTGEIIGHTTRKTCPLVGRRRQEIGTEKTFHRSLDAAVEETGQTARIAFAHQHFHYLVTVAAQQLFHCYGLGQMLKHMQHMTLHLVDANIAPPCYGRM